MKRWIFTTATLAAIMLTGTVRAAEPMPVYSPMPGGRVIIPVGAEPAPHPKNGLPAPIAVNDCYNQCEPGGGITVVLGAYYIRPVWERNPSHGWFSGEFDSISATEIARVDDFDFDHEFSPRIQIGYVACDGLGIRAGYQRFYEAAFTSISPVPDGVVVFGGSGFFGFGEFSGGIDAYPGETLLTEGRIKLNQFELEVTQLIDLNRWQATVAGGIRYTDLSQSFNGYVVNANGGLEEASVFGHRFQGVGPTVAIETRRPLGGGLAIYANARGSIIFGHKKVNAFGLEVDEGFFLVDAATSRQDVLPIGELELGAEFSRPTGLGTVFVRTGWYGGVYFGAGSSLSEDGNLGFHGIGVSFGVSR